MRLAAVILLLSVSLSAQTSDSIKKGTWEFGFFTGGGTWVPGGTDNTNVWNAGVRVGYLLTDHFEWAADLMPAYVVFQPSQTAYGAGITPLLLKYNFTRGHSVAPYLELGGGMLFTNHDVPLGTNHVNFTPQVAFGIQVFRRNRRSLNLAVRYVHISNAGLSDPNPGINTIQFTAGYHWWH